ncbi:MAG: hypothetical protein K8S97_06980, partial [Anaerolineae bacterium]|nr:hypothetical protein [Anaerolineae bacterium]
MRQIATIRQRWIAAATRGILVGLVLSIVFLGGVLIGGWLPADAQEQSAAEFGLLAQVELLLDNHYLRDVPATNEMEYAAIRGYMSALDDPYTYFIDPP